MKVVRLRLLLFGIFKYSAAQTIKPKFTDKVPFFVDLSVSKTHFTDKPAFPSYLSVKPGPKRLNFYGQTAIFAHFHRCVRKRQCFCQMQCSLNQRAKSSCPDGAYLLSALIHGKETDYFGLFPS